MKKYLLIIYSIYIFFAGFIMYGQQGRFKDDPFFYAVDNHDYKTVVTLLKNGTDINSIDSNDYFALIIAVYRRDFRMVKLLVDNGADVNMIGSFHTTSLIEACGYGDLEIVQYLIRHGANANLRFKSQPTPLMMACIYKHKDVVEYLLLNKADPNAWCYQGAGVPIIETALTFSIETGDLEIIKLLLENGTKINTIELHLKNPAANYASPIIYAWNKNYNTIRLIIKYAKKEDFNRDEKDLLKKIILKQAIDKNDIEIVSKINQIVN